MNSSMNCILLFTQSLKRGACSFVDPADLFGGLWVADAEPVAFAVDDVDCLVGNETANDVVIGSGTGTKVKHA